MTSDSTRIGVVGLGDLGGPIARRLSDVRGNIVGFDVDDGKMTALGNIAPARSVRDLAERVDIVLVIVSDAEQSEEVTVGTEGIAAATSQPQTVVIMSTIGPQAVRALNERLGEFGCAVVDAPVSGGAQRALNGDLAIMVGGTERAVSHCRDVLNDLGQVFPLGGLGAGQSAKLANQIVFFGAQAALQEAIALADSFHVDRAALLEALSGGTADCWAVRNWGFFDETARRYDESDVSPSHRPWHKDLATAATATRQQEVDAPVTDLIAHVFGDRVDQHARKAEPT